MTYHEVEEQALQLSVDERELLAIQLLRSIGDGKSDEIEGAWLHLAHQRLDEFEKDPSAGIPATQVHDEIKKEFGWT